jgi:hypothetical protein
MVSRFFWHAFSTVANFFKEGIEVVLPVKKLPQVYPGRAQAKAVHRIGIEEHGPVVKLLPE